MTHIYRLTLPFLLVCGLADLLCPRLIVASLNNLEYRTLAAAARSPRNPDALKSVMVFIPSLRFFDKTTFSTALFGLFNDLPVFLVNTTTAATPVPLTLLAVPQVIANDLSLAIPEYLNELTFIRLPGSLENCTAPLRAVLPLFTKKELLSLIRCHRSDSLMIAMDNLVQKLIFRRVLMVF